MASEASVHGLFAGPAARQKHHDGRVWWRTAVHRTVARKKKESERQKDGATGWTPTVPFRGTPPMTYVLQLGPTSQNSHQLPTVPLAGNKAFNP